MMSLRRKSMVAEEISSAFLSASHDCASGGSLQEKFCETRVEPPLHTQRARPGHFAGIMYGMSGRQPGLH